MNSVKKIQEVESSVEFSFLYSSLLFSYHFLYTIFLGLDACKTDLVCLSPSSVVFQSTTATLLEKKLVERGSLWGETN